MGIYAVTGSASGMGAAVVTRLRADGHTVVGVDIGATADVVADLSTADGRNAAIEQVLSATDNRLDGAVMAAGLGPTPDATMFGTIANVNYRGVVDLLEAWRPALAASGNAKVVVFGSNSSTTVPFVSRRAVRALLDGDTESAVRRVRRLGKRASPLVYAASKVAVSRWVRRTAIAPEWAGAGIRLNAIAPGAVSTPLLERQLDSPSEGRAVRSFPVPVGGFGTPDQIADWVQLMLSPSADFLCGSVVFVDGGSDAYLRTDDWPRPVPVRQVPRYLARFARFSRRTGRGG
ncbi:SDR family oxidoreductase [Rhodococcus sp. HNM0569]|uniref:SDR family oxidoreductase n=1 Tax=Rhodococcus sp. HNM0569 TaxID=2716340 RepID=UPI00146B309A|nr:SDR family oxidoreductase [Rhodococcus sp. HNM0569]NLU83795.1 SDR family oxidoreductase [Rhodococcus sp. HNM0569]